MPCFGAREVSCHRVLRRSTHWPRRQSSAPKERGAESGELDLMDHWYPIQVKQRGAPPSLRVGD